MQLKIFIINFNIIIITISSNLIGSFNTPFVLNLAA